MADNNQGGGPWGGGNGNRKGPWGGGGSGGPPGGMQPPDIEDIIRRGRERFKKLFPGNGSFRGISVFILLAIVLWLGSGFYRVQPGQVGVELLFGKFVKLTSPGLNFWLPSPIGTALTPDVERTNTINVGFRSGSDVGRSNAASLDVPEESLMLTGDQNIIDIDFQIQWRIKNASDYLFNIRDPMSTIKLAAESAMREVIGRTPLEEALTVKRQQVQSETKRLLQLILDEYGAGVAIAEIQLQNVDPPQPVIDAFNDVQRAKQDQERAVNEANQYANEIIPNAKGQAQKMIQAATAYKEKVVKEADGEARRFLSVYETYIAAKDVTTRRLYLERMQDILKNSEKVIIDTGKNGPGVLPYLPLPELQKRTKGEQQ